MPKYITNLIYYDEFNYLENTIDKNVNNLNINNKLYAIFNGFNIIATLLYKIEGIRLIDDINIDFAYFKLNKN